MTKENLPLILCGPILRRTAPSMICIWIAFSKPIEEVTSVLYKSSTDYKSGLIAKATQSTQAFAKNLHVALIIITPSEKDLFPTDEILQYDLKIDGKWLSDMPIIEELIYPPYGLPSFFIQSEKQPLNLLFGSCRKIHGPGFDALSCGDDLVQKHANQITKRPSVLFLGGDQIYADDISSVIMPIITSLSEKITGDEEKLLYDVNSHSNTADSTSTNTYHFGSRGALLSSEVGLEHIEHFADNHIIKWGEYAALYCLAWNSKLWPDDWEPSAHALTDKKEVFTNIDEKQKDKIVEKRIERHKTEIERVSRFFKTLPKVRRLLSNISCYMIFDDHEISDDWNTSFDWKSKMHNNSIGIQLLSNGLSNYAIFQAWGNQPLYFPPHIMENIRIFSEKASRGQIDFENRLSFYNDFTLGFDNWDFVSATYPRALFLDTRTQRSFEYFSDLDEAIIRWDKLKEKLISRVNKTINFILRATDNIINEDNAEAIARNTPARLINQKYFEWIKEKHGKQLKGQDILLISATPIFGLQRFEDVVRYGGQLFNIHQWDNEAWAANYTGYLNLLRFLSLELKPKNCVILSGDVHYGFAVSNEVELGELENATNYIQITSSSLKNNAKDQLDRIRKILETFEIYTDEEKVNKEINWIERREYHEFEANESEPVRIISNNNLGHLVWHENDLKFRFLFYQEDARQSGVSNTINWHLK